MTDWNKPGGLCGNCDPCKAGAEFSAEGDTVTFTQNAGYGCCVCCMFSTILICFAPCIFGTFCCSANASGLFFKMQEDKVNCVIKHKTACGQSPDIELKDIQNVTSFTKDYTNTQTNEDGEVVETGVTQVSAFKIVHSLGTYTSAEFPGCDQTVQAVVIKVNELVERGRQRRGLNQPQPVYAQPGMAQPQELYAAPPQGVVQQVSMGYAQQPGVAPQHQMMYAAPGGVAPQPQVVYTQQAVPQPMGITR